MSTTPGSEASVPRAVVRRDDFNEDATLPFSLRLSDFEAAMQDVYDLFYDFNTLLLARGLGRFDDMLRPAGMSGLISDALTESMARHSRGLTTNKHHNGHPDLLVAGVYPNDAAEAGEEGVEIKATRGTFGVDTHGAREQWLCVFRYAVDTETEPRVARAPSRFVEVGLAYLTIDDFRTNRRGELGTDTATPNKQGTAKLRANWIYREQRPATEARARPRRPRTAPPAPDSPQLPFDEA